jgi:flagellar motor component MotA
MDVMEDMVDFELDILETFAKENKDACLPVVEKMVAYSELVHEKGALILKESALEEENAFLKVALQYVYDAVDGDKTKEALFDMIFADGDSDSDSDSETEMLGKILMSYGILALQDGLKPEELRKSLLSMLS